MCFLLLEIVKEASVTRSIPAIEHHIEMELAGGHRMQISESHDRELLVRLMCGLSGASCLT